MERSPNAPNVRRPHDRQSAVTEGTTRLMTITKTCKNELTADRLREVLEYDQSTGEFRWIVRRRGIAYQTRAGRLARNGYWEICVDRTLFGAHRLAWLYIYGHWPPSDVDHIDGVRHNNRIENLRAATRSQNCANGKKSARNTSGYKGVRWSKHAKKWVARIGILYQTIHIGYFDSVDDAYAAYLAKADELFGEFSNGG